MHLPFITEFISFQILRSTELGEEYPTDNKSSNEYRFPKYIILIENLNHY